MWSRFAGVICLFYSCESNSSDTSSLSQAKALECDDQVVLEIVELDKPVAQSRCMEDIFQVQLLFDVKKRVDAVMLSQMTNQIFIESKNRVPVMCSNVLYEGVNPVTGFHSVVINVLNEEFQNAHSLNLLWVRKEMTIKVLTIKNNQDNA